MKSLEAVIVSVNYSDILAHTLPHNKQFFNKLVVVTDTKDDLTYNLCKNLQVECIRTDVFYNKGSKFDKGAGITEGLKHLTQDEWVLQMDADIWLHPFCMQQLRSLPLISTNIYGCDRVMVESFNDWIRFLNEPNLWNPEFWMLNMDRFKVGSRLTFYWSGDAWNVLGFFQLWNPKISGIDYYPSFTDASSSDIVFSQLWPRVKRHLIPEMLVIHIEEGQSQSGRNWAGRKMMNFYPSDYKNENT